MIFGWFLVNYKYSIMGPKTLQLSCQAAIGEPHGREKVDGEPGHIADTYPDLGLRVRKLLLGS